MIFKQSNSYELFKQRRINLVKKIIEAHGNTQGVIIIPANIEFGSYPFQQNASFYYLTGLNEPGLILFQYLDGRSELYIPQFTTQRSRWVNVIIDHTSNPNNFGFDQILYLGEPIIGYGLKPLFTIETYAQIIANLHNLIEQQYQIYSLIDESNENNFIQVMLHKAFCQVLPKLATVTSDTSSFIYLLRRSKDTYEIDLIYKAVQLTSMAQLTAASLIEKGRHEYEIKAGIEYVFTSVAASKPAFQSIVATGKNTTILHYTDLNTTLQPNDLVVIDIGATYGSYAADITRTYPVNGIFSPRQREVYTLVLEAQEYIAEQATPGMYLKNAKFPEKSLHHLAVAYFEKYGYANYFCHGIGHYLGLDVHDVGSYEEPLKPGDVFTIEPGLYLSEENIGIRIEDDYVMTDEGIFCLSHEIPKSIYDIEALLTNKHLT